MNDQTPGGGWRSQLRQISPGLHRFVTRDDHPYPMIRELLVGATLVLLLLGALWGFTGQPIGKAPVVVVESGSMMHCENGNNLHGDWCHPERYGRFGTIDPGDLVFVRDIDSASDVDTYAEGGKKRFGSPGDVIVYQPNGNANRTPIIHRAMFWLQINGDGTYGVPGLDLENLTDLNHPTLIGPEYRLSRDYHRQLENLGPEDSGFVTRGDNNPNADQRSITPTPVKPEWILGKARGEVPWMGLIKLRVTDWGSGTRHYDQAPGDVKVMLYVSLGILIGGPFLLEQVLKMRRRRNEEEEAGALPAAPVDDEPGDEAADEPEHAPIDLLGDPK